MSKLNIGDDVITLKGNGWMKEGAKGVVTAIASDHRFRVRFNNGESYWIQGDYLKKHQPTNETPLKWFPVPSYKVGIECHKILDSKGELVANFELLEDAIKVAELWNREVEK